VSRWYGPIGLGAHAQPISENGRSQPTTAQSNESATKNSDISAGVSCIGSELEAQDTNSDPYEKERSEREIRDLKTQESSAHWADLREQRGDGWPEDT
jgi:hypothetical protein